MNWKILLGVYYSPGSIFRKKSGCPLKAYCEWTMTLEWFLYCYQTWKRKKERKTTTAEFSFLRATKWRIECLSGVIEASLCPLESSPFMAVAASNQPSFNAPIQAHVRRARNTRFSFPVSFAALQIFTKKKKKKRILSREGIPLSFGILGVLVKFAGFFSICIGFVGNCRFVDSSDIFRAWRISIENLKEEWNVINCKSRPQINLFDRSNNL